jgi:hypothetical protein
MRQLTDHEMMVFDFMARRDYTRGHAERLHAVEAAWWETFVEAGPNGEFCPFTAEALAKIEAEREEIIERAVERYADGAAPISAAHVEPPPGGDV